MGQAAPDFCLETISGDTSRLSDDRGEKNVGLVSRRGRWCPCCARQLAEVKALLSDEQENGTQIEAMPVDPPEDLLNVSGGIG